MKLRYKYKIYPNNTQRNLLNITFGCFRVVYNSALALRKDLYEKIDILLHLKMEEDVNQEKIRRLSIKHSAIHPCLRGRG
jgi:transposase